jgi:uncharacterized protein YjbJ (UPF0337 family)
VITNHISVRIKKVLRNVKNIVFCTLAISATWLGIALSSTPSAMANSLELPHQFLASDVIQKMDRKAKSDVDKVAGYGTSDKLEGQVDKASGKIQRDLGKSRGEIEGAAKQARGKAKEDIGTTRRGIEKTADRADKASDNAIDSIKNFFSR